MKINFGKRKHSDIILQSLCNTPFSVMPVKYSVYGDRLNIELWNVANFSVGKDGETKNIRFVGGITRHTKEVLLKCAFRTRI